MRARARRQAGFSLLEVMVALAVFSLGALALLNVLGEGGRFQNAAADRVLARIVAENRLVEVMASSAPPSAGTSAGVDEQLARRWAWEVIVAPTSEPELLRVDVKVREDGRTQTLAELTTFRGAR
jgi:general secretion pathway protein I